MSTELKGKKTSKSTKKLNGKTEIQPKAYGIKRFINSVTNSIEGLQYAYTHEQSLLLHVILSIVAIVLSIVFKITGTQWILLFLVMTTIIIAELLNTAIEAVVDMFTEEYHPLAKVAKDCSSAAAFVASLLAIAVGGSVFIPKIITLIFKR